jgi:GntR family transcriptional regulator, transcriptional repressor for pyruvate dehydrogenase complex
MPMIPMIPIDKPRTLAKIHKPRTLTQEVSREIVRQIIAGHLKPGDQFPPEPELMRQLHVSRGVVREALKIVAVLGLARIEQGKGTYVCSRSDYFLQPISWGLWGDNNLKALQEARRGIEVEVAGLAAERGTPRDLVVIESHLAEMKRSHIPEKWAEYVKADMSFHFALAEASHNAILNQFMTLLHNMLQQLVAMSDPTYGEPTPESPGDHEELFAAVRAHQSGAAREAMKRLLSNADRHLPGLSNRKVHRTKPL